MTFPENLIERNEYILQAVKDGKAQFTWVPLTSEIPGYKAVFYVSSDALKIEGVRINVSAYLQQQIADLLDASLLTVKLADLRFAQAKIRLEPKTRPITSATSAMIEQSAKIDKLLTNPGYSSDKDAIISTVGKDWCISDETLTAPKNRGVNYGWHFAGATKFQGVQGYPCDSLEKDKISGMIIYTIQPSAESHDYNHVDYSQVCCLVKQDCIVNDQKMRLIDLLQDEKLAKLASHTGKMKIIRQPGPAPLSPLTFKEPMVENKQTKDPDVKTPEPGVSKSEMENIPVILDPEHPAKMGLTYVQEFNWKNLFDIIRNIFSFKDRV